MRRNRCQVPLKRRRYARVICPAKMPALATRKRTTPEAKPPGSDRVFPYRESQKSCEPLLNFIIKKCCASRFNFFKNRFYIFVVRIGNNQNFKKFLSLIQPAQLRQDQAKIVLGVGVIRSEIKREFESVLRA